MIEIYEELGIGFIGAYLRQKGYVVTILGYKEDEVPYQALYENNFHVIGMPIYSDSKESVCRVATKIKQHNSETIICVGGVLSTYYGKTLLEECGAFDIAVKGEGEITFHEIVSCIYEKKDIHGVKGIFYRSHGDVCENLDRPSIEDLNILTMPARDYLMDKNLSIAQISTSRGCVGICSFCASQLSWKKWRGRPISQVVDEIEELTTQYNIRIFNFIDASFEDPDPGLSRMTEMVDEIIRRSIAIGYFADFRSDFYKKADDAVMKKLKDSGLCGVCIGIESGNDEDLKIYKKRTTVEDNNISIAFFKSYGINVEPGFINFNPYTTISKLKKNIRFLEHNGYACNIDYIVNRFKMYPGTTLYGRVLSDDLVHKDMKSDYAYSFIDHQINDLYEFVILYQKFVNKTHQDAFKRLTFYSGIYQTMLVYLEKQVAAQDFKILALSKKRIQVLLNEANEQMAKWFRLLIEICESGWDEKAASLESDYLLGKGFLAAIVRKIENINNRMMFLIQDINPAYETVLKTIFNDKYLFN